MPVAALTAVLADLVLPRFCIACRRPGRPLCARCSPAELVRLDASGLPVVAAGAYAGAVRAALIAYKEHDRRDLAAPLGDLLGRAVAGAPAGAIAPVPSAAPAARARGGDHVLRLARVVARRGPARVATPLRLARQVRDSAGLGVRERAANLCQAMTAGPPPAPGTAVVIVDDIVTTGATLREAARALTAAGWTVAGAAVVAATARHASPVARPGRPV